MFSVVFEDNFLLLPTRHQEIWKVIWHFCKHHRNAFPSHHKLAELAHCSIRTVVNAMRAFKNFGWLSYLKRCYRSNVYFIHKELLMKDPKDKNLFKNSDRERGGVFRENCVESCVVYNAARTGIATERKKDVHPSRAFSSGKWLSIHPSLQNLPFETEDKIKIQRRFTEAMIGRALESYHSYRFVKYRPIALFWWLCNDAKEYFKNRKKYAKNSRS